MHLLIRLSASSRWWGRPASSRARRTFRRASSRSRAADPTLSLRASAEPPNATVDWDGTPFAVAFLRPLEYNATRDATLAGTLVCSHRACGPLVWVKGQIEEPRAFRLLVPTSAAFTFEDVGPAPPPPRPAGEPPAPTPPTSRPSARGYEHVRFAIAEPFETREPLAPALLHGAARLAPLLPLGLLTTQATTLQRVMPAAGVALGAWLALHAHEIGFMGILYGLLVMVAVGVGGLGVMLIAVVKRRVSPGALVFLAAGVAFLLTLAVADAYMPDEGWGD